MRSGVQEIKTDSADGYFMGGNSLTGFTIALQRLL